MTDQERIAFLEGQLALAITHLREKDATEEACAKRFEALYAERFAAAKDALEDAKRQFAAAASRYALIRQHMVRVRKLDILASGPHLDYLLDKILKEGQSAA